ncbi:ribonuclease T2 family protein [Pseudoroseicyclus sp. CXY001]|uniref:ribonuclease T2 family protein n=1 Tax=Pseudoroseicyclus sp. CXY001 TaxID=3242492 RepID=UPI0035711EFD
MRFGKIKIPLGPVMAALLWGGAGMAQDVAGRFDHYVLALSWSPTWCAQTGAERGSPQCDGTRGLVLHGLWPQHRIGWPEYCDTDERGPGRAEVAAMLPLMGDPSAVTYQWRKHGACSGLSAAAFFALARQAVAEVAVPELLTGDAPQRLSAQEVEAAMLRANPDMVADGVTVTCRDGHIAEIRLCLTKTLEPRPCEPDVRRDCRLADALLPAP